MTWRPLGPRLLLKRIIEDKSAGGILLPDTAKKDGPKFCEVIQLGNGIDQDGKKQPFHVKVGDRVGISRYAGTEFSIGGEDHIVIHQSEVLVADLP